MRVTVTDIDRLILLSRPRALSPTTKPYHPSSTTPKIFTAIIAHQGSVTAWEVLVVNPSNCSRNYENG